MQVMNVMYYRYQQVNKKTVKIYVYEKFIKYIRCSILHWTN